MKRRISPSLPAGCPYIDCSAICANRGERPASGRIVRKGYYWRVDDGQWITRLRCLDCRRSFSSSRLTSCFLQKKRKVNTPLGALLGSGVSLRRAAKLLRLNRKTVVRKQIFLGKQAKIKREEKLAERILHQPHLIQHIQFDEMESFERSKCLPLSIPMVVIAGTREILSFRVGSMPAKGPLARISREKYGFRKDERPQRVDSMMREIAPALALNVEITTDQKPQYPAWIRPLFPGATHKTTKGRRGCVGGQGELKKIGFDPLFSFNHTAAMLRANINRLFRRTWCTTKRADRLADHIELYIQYHNEQLIAPATP